MPMLNNTANQKCRSPISRDMVFANNATHLLNMNLFLNINVCNIQWGNSGLRTWFLWIVLLVFCICVFIFSFIYCSFFYWNIFDDCFRKRHHNQPQYSFCILLSLSFESKRTERPLNSLSALVCPFYLYLRFESSLFTHTIRVQIILPNMVAIFFLRHLMA